MIRVNLNRIPEIDRETNEAYKQLRTNIMFCGDDIKTIMITSTQPNEGKSEVSYFLAHSIGESGKRVLLLDADIRKSMMASRFMPDKNVHGLSHYLAGQDSLDDIICQTNVHNLYMIFAGASAPNPSELLGNQRFPAMLTALKKVFDYVIIDSPPIGTVIDAAVIGTHTDGCVLVIGYDQTSYKLIAKAKNQLEKVGCHMLGAVLNRVDTRKNSYYGGYYGRYYGRSGEKNNAETNK